MTNTFKYYAFISYKREDERWAKWLQRKLEVYRIPTALRKRNPDLPERVRPIFKDTTDLSGGVLEQAINEALEQSKYLIVICSPKAAKSEWVCREVQRFIDLGKEQYIIPFIVDGTPFSNDATECFPTALKALSGEKELLGININENGQDAAAIKVVARMFNVSFDTLWQRHRRAEKRRRRIIAAVASLFTLCVLAVAGYIWQKNWKLMEAQARAVAPKVIELTREGDTYTAQLLALSILPKELDQPDRPCTPEAESAFRMVTHANTLLKGHISRVFRVSYSMDGKYIVSASQDNTIRLWDAETHKQIGQPFIGHEEGVLCAAFSPDSRYLVSASSDTTIRIWDVQTHEQIGKPLIGHTAGVCSAVFSPDGKYIVSASYSDPTIRIWDTETHKQIGEPLIGHTNGVQSASFSPDGRYIVSASSDETIRIWEVETHKQVGDALIGHTGDVCSAVFSPDGKYIVSASDDRTVRLWDIETHEQVGEPFVGHISGLCSAAFSPDGKYIVSAASDGIRIWDTETHKQIGEPLIDNTGFLTSASYSPNGKYIISSSIEDDIRIWNADFCTRLSKPLQYRWHNNNELYWDEKSVEICNELVEALEPISTSEIVAWRVFAYSNVASLMFAWEDIICIWDIEKDKQIGQSISGHTGRIRHIILSPNGKSIVSASDDMTIRIWDVETHEQIGKPLEGHTDYIRSIEFSPNGKYIVSASSDSTIRVWNVETQEQIGEPLIGHTDWVESASFSADGKYIVSASQDSTIRIWDVETHEQIGNPLVGHTEEVTFATFSPNGKYLVSASWDNTVRIWDTGNGKQIRESFTYPIRDIHSICFSLDDNYIILTNSNGENVYIWDWRPLQELIDETRERFKDRELTPEEKRMYYLRATASKSLGC